jgi:protease-4
VWTGEQAKALGLVDELGGFYEAVDKAKALSGLSGQAVKLKVVRAHGSPLGAFGKLLGVGEDGVRAISVLGAVLGDPKIQGLMSEVRAANLRSNGAMVLAPTPIR